MGEVARNRGGPRVLVLLATYNGARFLDTQLASLRDQDIDSIDIRISDDDSMDRTLAILARWQVEWPKGSFEFSCQPHAGFSENFRRLAVAAETEADYIAFCDQDDIWDRDKLSVAIAALAVQAPDRPAVYFSRTRLVDAAGCETGQCSPLFGREPGFSNAIVQSIGGGNTMVLNVEGFRLFTESARRTAFVSHDWWGYLIVSGAGGYVHYDPAPHIGYRQHDANAVGSNTGWGARLARLRRLLGSGVFAGWNSSNIAALRECADLLSPGSLATLAEFTDMRRIRLAAGIRRLLRSGIRRQTLPGNIALAVAVALGKT